MTLPVPPFPPPLAPADPRPTRTVSAAVAPPSLGAAAVTAAADTSGARLDPQPTRGTAVVPLDPPADPPPVKGLGIPPLNTRQVGDFDELPPVLPPRGTYGASALIEPPPAPAPRLDLRR